MLSEYVNFWRRCKLTAPPFAHPDDIPFLQQDGIDTKLADFEGFIGGPRFGDFEENGLHLSLLPVPYVGNLHDADIVILLLNPGFTYSDYWAEYKVPAFRKRSEETLYQSLDGVKFPFFGLDPQFCFHGGFLWWEKKLRDVITVAKMKLGCTYLEAMRELSTRLACIELVPYHSSSFRAHSLIGRLPSVQMAQRFVRESLLPDARAGRRTLIVTRQVKAWGLPTDEANVILYKDGHTRGASLSPNSDGGKAILKRFGVKQA